MTAAIAIVNSKSFGRYFPEHLKRLEAIGPVDIFDLPADVTGKELASLLEKYHYIIASVTPLFDQTFFAHAPQLKLISRHGLGFNNIDIESAAAHGVYITKVSGPLERDAVAELAVGLILTQVRGIVAANEALKNGRWSEKAMFYGREIHDMTVGIIGFGNIGSRVGEILHGGFGNEVVANDPYVSAETIAAHGCRKVSLGELLAVADVISLNASVTETSTGILDQAAISRMKPGVMITNTARGQLIVLDDLVQALQEKQVASYAADVFVHEPIESDNPLIGLSNTILTPHIAAYTDISLLGMGNKCVKDVEDVHFGRVPIGLVTPSLKRSSSEEDVR